MLIKRTVDKLASSSQDRIKLLNLQNAIKAADQEGLVNYKAQLLYLGGAFVIQHNLAKLAFGLSWLREAKRLYTALEGEDSLQVAELQAQLCGMH